MLAVRLLVLSIPVLVVGLVTYRKARSGLLDTARQNLRESAIAYGKELQTSSDLLIANVTAIGTSTQLRSDRQNVRQALLQHWVDHLPLATKCARLFDARSGELLVQACPNRIPRINLVTSTMTAWPAMVPPNRVRENPVRVVIPPRFVVPTVAPSLNRINAESVASELGDLSPPSSLIAPSDPKTHLFPLALSTPLYTESGVLESVLVLEAGIELQYFDGNGSLSGHPVVIDESGFILLHNREENVGRNIRDLADRDRLESVLRRAIQDNQQDFFHLKDFTAPQVESVAGYTAIPSPVTHPNHVSIQNQNGQDHPAKLVILAVTRLDNALYNIVGLQQVFASLILGLFAVTLFATLYLVRDLASPLEKLQRYVRKVQVGNMDDLPPPHFKILEFDHLAQTLQGMIQRLLEWSQQIEEAWREARTANQLKTEFLTTISHELRTPLNGIIGFLNLIGDGYCDTPEEEQEFIHKARQSSLKLLAIIEDILDISKIEAGTLVAELEPTDLRTILTEAIATIAESAETKNLTLQVPQLEKPVMVQADPSKLTQVLRCVLSNAVKFTDQGSITIRVITPDMQGGSDVQGGDAWSSRAAVSAATSLGAPPPAVAATTEAPEPSRSQDCPIPGEVVVQIIDTGAGIESSQMDKIFRPFVMVDGSRTRRHGGAGLGLAIASNLMELMEGNIQLYSAGLNCGTTVVLHLRPILVAPPRHRSGQTRIPSPPSSQGEADRSS